MKVYIPGNQYGIPIGYYSRNQFVELLRKYSEKTDIIVFLADMLEE